MKRLLFLVLAAACQTQTQPQPPMLKSAVPANTINPFITNCNITAPPEAPAKVTFAMATSGLPCALAFANPVVDLKTLQEAFDFNSWLTFVALSAPADGSPIGPDKPTIWEGFQDLFDTLLPNGATPPPYGESVPPPAICASYGNGELMRMISKTPVTPTLEVSGQPLNTGPMIDQNGHYVRYQILINKPMYEYIVANELYSKAGQERFTEEISFPVGQVTTGTNGTIGAIVVKAAWKVLDPADPNDDPSKFHVTKARVYTPPAPGVPESCHSATMGLVGLHIVHKTANEPQWIWSTFEHVDNVPTIEEAKNPPANKHYNFFNPACSVTACPHNRQPPQPWNPSIDPYPTSFRSQIVRATIYEPVALGSADLWNGEFHSALGTSVWNNYELITTQWPTDGTNPVDPDGVPFPLFAANSTMETYVQGNVPQASSTCMGCHGNATSMSGRTSDFSFVLERAN